MARIEVAGADHNDGTIVEGTLILMSEWKAELPKHLPKPPPARSSARAV